MRTITRNPAAQNLKYLKNKLGYFIISAFLMLGVFSSISCSGSDNGKSSEANQHFVESKLGKGYRILSNHSKSYTLCFKAEKVSVDNELHVAVFNSKNQQLVFEKKISHGSVSWFDDQHIKIIEPTGTVRVDQHGNEVKNQYLIDIETGKRSPVPSAESK